MNTIVCKLPVVLAVMVLPSPLCGTEPSRPRLVTVTGTADVKVVPNEVIVTLGVETLDLDINQAKADNDKRVKKAFEIAKAHGVEQRHVQTDHVSIQPKREFRRDGSARREEFVGFEVRQTIEIRVGDLSKYEPLVGALLEAGVNYIHNIDFRTTELRKHKDEARALAIKAAREKATALADALGQRLGNPHSITENRSRSWSSFGSWWGGTSWAASNVAVVAPGDIAAADSTIAPGQILITASVTVSFAMQ